MLQYLQNVRCEKGLLGMGVLWDGAVRLEEELVWYEMGQGIQDMLMLMLMRYAGVAGVEARKGTVTAERDEEVR